MKTPSILKLALCAAGFSAFALMGGAQAQIIVVNYTGAPGESLDGSTWNADVTPIAYTGTRVNDVGITGAVSNLLSTTGTSTGIGYTTSGVSGIVGNSVGNLPVPSPITMFYAALYSGGTATLTLTGLTGSSYDLALVGEYSSSSGSLVRGTSYTINGVTQSDTSEATSAGDSFILGTTYVEFTNIAPVSGDITFTFTTSGNADHTFGFLNGFELVTDVPEPSSLTMAMLGLGALVLMFRLRRAV